MKLHFSIAAFILFLVNISPIFLSLITGFSRQSVLDLPFILFYLFCLSIAIMGVYFGNMIRIKGYPKFKLLPERFEKIIENKPTTLVVLILIIQISYLTILISSIDNFWEKIAKLIQLDFYSLRYELVESAYKGVRSGGEKSVEILLKNLDRLFVIAANIINGFIVNIKKNATRDRLIFLPITFILMALSVIRGSRTVFVVSIISFLIGISYGRIKKSNPIEKVNFKTESSILKRDKIEKRNYKLIVITIISVGLIIVGKITNDRVGRMDVKNLWLKRYEINIGASTKYCNKLCNNPIIAGATGYTLSPFLYSKKEFDKQLNNPGISEGFGLGYKSFWFPHQALNKIPIINKITAANKDNWLNNLEYNHSRNNLKRSSWRGLIHDYIYDWGIYFAPFAIFFSYSLVGYLEGLSKRSNGLKSLLCSTVSILFSILSIAIQPFNSLFLLAIIAILL